MRARLAFAAVCFSACTFDGTVPPATTVLCNSEAECPHGYTCAATRGICVLEGRGSDLTAPVLSATADRTLTRPGERVVLTVTADEPLAAAPQIDAEQPGLTRHLVLVDAADMTRFTFTYDSQLGDADGVVRLFGTAEDLAQNVTKAAPLGTVTIDGTPPDVSAVRITPTRVAPSGFVSATVSFSEEIEPGAVIVAASPAGERFRSTSTTRERTLRVEVLVPLTSPSEVWTFTLDAVRDAAGNAHAAVDLGTVEIDADPPVVMPLLLNGKRYSAQPGFDDIAVPLNVTGATVIDVCLDSACQDATDAGAVVHLRVDAAHPEGLALVQVRARDDVGNRTDEGASVLFDFTAPRLVSSDLRYVAPPFCPRPTVAAATVGGLARLSFTTDEPTGADPVVDAGALAFVLRTSATQSFVFEHVPTDAGVNQTESLEVLIVDDVGNRRQASAGTVTVDTAPPAALGMPQRARFVYRRVPWGATASSYLPEFTVTADAGTFAPDTFVSIWSGPDRTASLLLASAVSDPTGALPRLPLPLQDLPIVYFTQYDLACNPEGPLARAVPIVDWVATMGNKVIGAAAPNPHRFLDVPSSTPNTTVHPVLRELAVEPARDDGVVITSRGPGGRWRTLGPPPNETFVGNCFTSDPTTGELYVWGPFGPTHLGTNLGYALRSGRWESVGAEPRPILTATGRCGYDTTRRRLVTADPSATWEWDGAQWTRFPNSDGYLQIDEMIGTPGSVLGLSLYSDQLEHVFQYVGAGMWSEVSYNGLATGRYGSRLAFHPPSGHLWLFGGQSLAPGGTETELWDGDSTWTLLDPGTGPAGNGPHGALVYDPLTGQMLAIDSDGNTNGWETDHWDGRNGVPAPLMVGGLSDPLNQHALVLVDGLDLYESDGTDWLLRPLTKVTPVTAQNAVSANTGALTRIGGSNVVWYGAHADAGFEGTFVWNGLDWQTTGGVGAAARMNYVTAGRAVMFGGPKPTTSNTLWRWTGAAWVSVPQSGTWPTARTNMNMVAGLQPSQVMMVGGKTSSAVVDEVWFWNTTTSTWSSQGPSRPPRRFDTALELDTDRNQIVMFGGATSIGSVPTLLGDTWVWDGGSWRQPLDAGSNPSPRAGAQLAYDAQRQVMVLHGGSGLDDTWEWDGQAWLDVTASAGKPAGFGHAFYDSNARAVMMMADDGTMSIYTAQGRQAHRLALDFAAAQVPALNRLRGSSVVFKSSGPELQRWSGTVWTTAATVPVDGGVRSMTVSFPFATLFNVGDGGQAQLQVVAPLANRAPLSTDYVEVTVRYENP